MSSSTATAEDPFTILGETLETAAGALDAPTVHARESAHRAAATTKRVVGSGVYSVSYALAYGAVFAATYVHDLLPEGSAVQRGLSDGSDDALSSRSRRHLLKQAPTSTLAPRADVHAGHEAHDHPVHSDTRQHVDALAGKFDGEH
ncbi:hypothetical protein [Methylobacterium organophilum]|uniref:Transmembrane protein n=1 Tax=Methylobacterium organophilum TaxID=410 RepID=A0ABQ4TA78_METOR|nr:hypothetical protein [Methylobacterium organophilum]GJE28133.1 hypothetical protein LKMONMHP_3000 [Methylobacterium organophilum]